MKPILFHNPKTLKGSFYLQEDNVPHFYDSLHYHPEFQLTLILKGTGNLLLGDYIGRFEPGDVYFIGPDVAHVFRCDQEYYQQHKELKAHGVSIYFNGDTFGSSFFDLPENSEIKKLLKSGQRGIKVEEKFAGEVAAEILALKGQNGLKRLTSFLLCLERLSKIKSGRSFLSSPDFSVSDDEDNDRMNQVFSYIMNNFSKEIKLSTVAGIACMTPNAFCRYFNRKTRKTLMQFVTEARIGYACKLLLQEKYTILEISYRCGYNNISNFNRQFLRILKSTPSEYIKKASQMV